MQACPAQSVLGAICRATSQKFQASLKILNKFSFFFHFWEITANRTRNTQKSFTLATKVALESAAFMTCFSFFFTGFVLNLSLNSSAEVIMM